MYFMAELTDKNKKAWWQPAIIIFARFSVWIFVPVILGAFLGKWLDKKYSTEPILFLVIVGVAFLISMFGLIRGVMEEYKKIEKEANNLKDKNQK
jgi:MFS-type transporter involved in bile tolerance (Atg22 family)